MCPGSPQGVEEPELGVHTPPLPAPHGGRSWSGGCAHGATRQSEVVLSSVD